jgi:hypothetical protein
MTSLEEMRRKGTLPKLNHFISTLPREGQCAWETALRELDGTYVDSFDNIGYAVYTGIHPRRRWPNKIKRIWQQIIKVLSLRR